MTPQAFAKAIVSIEQNYGLKLDAAETWLRLDEFKKVKELKGGKCNEAKGWYGLKGACKRGKKGEGEAKGKESKMAIAGKIKARKQKGETIEPEQKSTTKKTSEVKESQSRSVDFEVKQTKLLDIESISSGSAKAKTSKVESILKSGLQSELPIVVIKSKKGSLGIDTDTDTYSGAEEIASYREAVKRNPNLKGRMDVIIARSKEEAIAAAKQQDMIATHSKRREPIKEARLLDVESFKVKNTDFKKADIEELAQSISRNGGIYQGPQVKQSGIEEWTTRSGSDDFAVLAYRRAQELNPNLKGRIMAQFV
jgi:hypothetical protein